MKLGINVVLVLAALLGLSLAARETLLRKDLSREYGILAAEVGYLESTGEPGVQVIALPTEDPRHFRWRIVVPENETFVCKTSVAWDRSVPMEGPLSFIAHVRFRDGENGCLKAWWDLKRSWGTTDMGGAQLYEFLKGRWDEMEIEQLASDGRVTVRSGQLSSLLRISMPDQMREDAQESLSPQNLKWYVPELFHLQLGSDAEIGGSARTDASASGREP